MLANDAEKARLYVDCPTVTDFIHRRSTADCYIAALIHTACDQYIRTQKKRRDAEVGFEEAYSHTRAVVLQRMRAAAAAASRAAIPPRQAVRQWKRFTGLPVQLLPSSSSSTAVSSSSSSIPPRQADVTFSGDDAVRAAVYKLCHTLADFELNRFTFDASVVFRDYWGYVCQQRQLNQEVTREEAYSHTRTLFFGGTPPAALSSPPAGTEPIHASCPPSSSLQAVRCDAAALVTLPCLSHSQPQPLPDALPSLIDDVDMSPGGSSSASPSHVDTPSLPLPLSQPVPAPSPPQLSAPGQVISSTTTAAVCPSPLAQLVSFSSPVAVSQPVPENADDSPPASSESTMEVALQRQLEHDSGDHRLSRVSDPEGHNQFHNPGGYRGDQQVDDNEEVDEPKRQRVDTSYIMEHRQSSVPVVDAIVAHDTPPLLSPYPSPSLSDEAPAPALLTTSFPPPSPPSFSSARSASPLSFAPSLDLLVDAFEKAPVLNVDAAVCPAAPTPPRSPAPCAGCDAWRAMYGQLKRQRSDEQASGTTQKLSDRQQCKLLQFEMDEQKQHVAWLELHNEWLREKNSQLMRELMERE